MSDNDCGSDDTDKNIIKPRVAPRYCCINGCLITSKNSPNTKFFRIPCSSERAKLWLKSMGREDLLEKNVKVNSFCVCDAHFEKIHIQTNRNRTRLSLKAVPTLNLNNGKNNVDTTGSSLHQDQRACAVCSSKSNNVMNNVDVTRSSLHPDQRACSSKSNNVMNNVDVTGSPLHPDQRACSSQSDTSDTSVNDPICSSMEGYVHKGRLNSNGSEVTMAGWTKEETFEFIKLYKSFPHLWNKNSDLYQNKYAREKSLISIMNHMGPDKFRTTQDVKIKIKNLRTTYHQVTKKVSRAEKEGYSYIPTLSWFYDFKEIMDAERLEAVKQENDSDFSDDIYAPSTSADDISSIFVESMPNEADEENYREDSIKIKRIKIENEGDVDYEPTFREHFQKEGIVNDEFQMFANNIAEQLRQLPLDRALKMQLEIHQLVAAERTKMYKQSFSETKLE